MKAADLRDKTPDQLREDLAQLKKEAFNLRFQAATGQLEGTARMKSVRRDVARVKTVLNEKAAAAAAETQAAAAAADTQAAAAAADTQAAAAAGQEA